MHPNYRKGNRRENDIDRKKLAIEQQHLKLDKKRLKFESRFLNKHFGAIVTSAVSLAAIVVSIGQIKVARIDKEKEIAVQNIQKSKELQQKKIEQDRLWNLQLADFVVKYEEEIFSSDTQKNRRIRDVILVTFPPKITTALFSKLEFTAPRQSKTLWKEGKDIADVIISSGALATNWVSPISSHQYRSLAICSFNIQYLGISVKRDNTALAEILKGYDIVIIQELVSPPFEGAYPGGEPYRPDTESAQFFNAMAAHGFTYELSEEDTGPGEQINRNGSSTEWWVVFFKESRVKIANDLPNGFLADDRSNHNDYERVPYAFGMRSADNGVDFVLISVHLKPGTLPENATRRKHELSSIAHWISQNNNTEKDFVIVGDMNIPNKAECDAIAPPGYTTLNDEFYQTNTYDRKPMAYDHVLFNPKYTTEIDHESDFRVIDLVNAMKRLFAGNPKDYPGDPYDHNMFRAYYSDHHPIEFRLNITANDDD